MERRQSPITVRSFQQRMMMDSFMAANVRNELQAWANRRLSPARQFLGSFRGVLECLVDPLCKVQPVVATRKLSLKESKIVPSVHWQPWQKESIVFASSCSDYS